MSDPNICVGAAAAAMLGSDLAEWQKKREEEAARSGRINRELNAGQGDEDEIHSRCRGKAPPGRRYKDQRFFVHAQEQAWEAAKVQQQAKPANKTCQDRHRPEERLAAYKQTAIYQARQESYAEYYAKKEQRSRTLSVRRGG
ncbi:hypothetical protein MASR1M74_12960 [Lentimicrobium sp.]